MDWSLTKVRQWDKKNMERYIKNFHAEGHTNIFAIKITSSNPKGLFIDWKKRQQILDNGWNKFEWRNVDFKRVE